MKDLLLTVCKGIVQVFEMIHDLLGGKTQRSSVHLLNQGEYFVFLLKNEACRSVSFLHQSAFEKCLFLAQADEACAAKLVPHSASLIAG